MIKEEPVNIYAGNLSRETNEDDLKQVFSSFGDVEGVTLIKDKSTGESKGFGFVKMPNPPEARKAMAELNGQILKGQRIKVNKAFPRGKN